MPIFEFKDFDNPLVMGDDNPHLTQCIFCKNALEEFKIEDYWEIDLKEIKKIHQENAINYKEIHGLEDCYLNLDYNKMSTETWLNFCNKCGWWRIQKDVSISAEAWQIWQFFFGISGILKQLDIENIDTPLDETSKYLLAKYESRFSINPRLFEEVTASVFRNLGYNTLVTGYSNDGGIDVIMENNSKYIGVQVKRYKNKIKVDQIRELTGALFINNIPNGIFVTTSDFQKGAHKTSTLSSNNGIPIELINAKRFYEILKLTCSETFDKNNFMHNLSNLKVQKLFSYKRGNPMNTL